MRLSPAVERVVKSYRPSHDPDRPIDEDEKNELARRAIPKTAGPVQDAYYPAAIFGATMSP
jgi:hypothetical protein